MTGKSLGIKAENKAIDSFFEGMDRDGGGSLILQELKPALKTLQKKSATVMAEQRKMHDQSAGLEVKVNAIIELARITESVETEEMALKQVKESPSAAAKIGVTCAVTNECLMAILIAVCCDPWLRRRQSNEKTLR